MSVKDTIQLPSEVVLSALAEMRRYHAAYCKYMDHGSFDDLEVYMAYAAEISRLGYVITEMEGAL